MRELHIDSAGEVRLGSDIVGHIAWAGPCAHYDVAGEWDKSGGSCCWSCGGFLAPAEDFEDVQDERDQLKVKLEEAQSEIEKLKRKIKALRGADSGDD